MKVTRAYVPPPAEPTPEGRHTAEASRDLRKLDRLSGLEALLKSWLPFMATDPAYVANLKQRVYAARTRMRNGL